MEKFQSKDLRLIGVCVLVILASLFILDKYFYQAFPEASIQFKVGREESKPVAENFLRELGIGAATEDYRHSVIFDHDDQAKVFLERELGLEEAGKLMGSRVKLWRWSHRWFKPLQKEEWRVSVAPDGAINGFVHELPEDADGAKLSPDSAQIIAENFLRESMSLDLAQLELVDKDTKQRPNRSDHTFTYKISALNIHEADYRYAVGVWGSTVGSFSEFLHVPEAWQRDYAKLRARNDTTGLIAAAFLFITIFGALWFFIDRARKRDVRWNTATWFAIIGGALTFLAQLNGFNLQEFGYDTTESYTSFVFTSILQALMAGAGAGLLIFILTAGGEPLYRERYGDKLSLTNHFRWRGLRSKDFVTGTILGIALAFFFALYQTGFYIFAKKFGAWSPADIPYSDLLNTTFPWIFVLLAGFLPAVSEEFISRLFSIPFLEKVLKHRWLAVVIPALIWGFGHSNYPQQPFYIRGLEVGIAGIIIGYLMLRYNILVTLIWHYTVDALYTSLLMFRSGNTYLTVSAAIASGIMLVPLAVALFMYWRRGGFEPRSGLLNSDEGSSLEVPRTVETPEVSATQVATLPAKVRNIGLVVTIVLLGAFFLPGERFGEFVDVKYQPSEAIEMARTFLTEQGFSLEGYNDVRILRENVDDAAVKYALLHGGVARANRLYDAETPAVQWGVRFFKSLTKEEYRVYFDARNKKLLAYVHELDEAAPGDSLDEQNAMHTAHVFLASQSIDVENFVLKESSSEKRKARRDYHFVWEAPEGDPRHIAEAKYRINVDVQGNKIGRFETYLKLPESFERERRERGVWFAVHIGLMVVGFGLLLGLAIVYFVKFARSGAIPWRQALLLAIPIAVLGTLIAFNRFDFLRWRYDTSFEYQLFMTTIIVGLIIQLIFLYAVIALLLGFVFAAYPHARTSLKFSEWRPQANAAIWATIILVASLLGLRQLSGFLEAQFPNGALLGYLPGLDTVDATSPTFGYLLDALGDAFRIPAALAVIVFLFARVIKKSLWQIVLVIVLVIASTPLSAQSFSEVALQAGQTLLLFAWLWMAVRFIARDNVLAYLSASLCYSLVSGGLALSRLSATEFSYQGVALFIMAAGWMLVLVWIGRGVRSAASGG